jgi:hypothetical protein
MSRYPILMPVSLISDLSPDQCFAKLRRRREKGPRNMFDNVVYSLRLGKFVIAGDSLWSWINRSSEPKFLGRVSAAGSGSRIAGYLIPGFGFILCLVAAFFVTMYLVYLLVMRLLDPTTVYSLNSPSTVIALLIFTTLTAFGWFVLLRFWKPLVWDDTRLIKRLSKLLNAKEI